MISPPTSNGAVRAPLLPTALEEFNYEPRFPLAILDSPEGMELQKRENRLARDGGVDLITAHELDGQDAFVKIEQWLDEIGI